MAAKRPAAAPRGLLTKALIYTRVSSDDQANEWVSLAAQLGTCLKYAQASGWIIAGEYQDVMSGAKDHREQYQALLTEARRLRGEGQPVAVVVARLDRFGRKLKEQVDRRAEFKELGVALHAALGGGEVSDLVANILASVAENELEDLRQRLKAAFNHIKGGGWNVSGRPAWGYVRRPATLEERNAGAPRSVLDVDAVAAPYVREVFDRLAGGASLRSVAAWIHSLPPEVRQGDAAIPRNLRWNAVCGVVTSPVYIARHHVNGTHGERDAAEALALPRGRWPALVTDETWAKAQAHLAGHAATPHQGTDRYLLTGFARCPLCDRRMVHQPAGRVSGRLRRYVCTGIVLKKCSYSAGAAAAEDLTVDDVVGLVAIAGSGLHPTSLRALRQRMREFEAEEAVWAQRAQEHEAKAAKARERISRATEMRVDGELDKPAYDDLCSRAQAELSAAEGALEQLRESRPERGTADVETIITNAGQWATALQHGTMLERRDVLRLLVDKVVLFRIAHAQYEVNVYYTPLGETARKMLSHRAQLRIHASEAS